VRPSDRPIPLRLVSSEAFERDVVNLVDETETADERPSG